MTHKNIMDEAIPVHDDMLLLAAEELNGLKIAGLAITQENICVVQGKLGRKPHPRAAFGTPQKVRSPGHGHQWVKISHSCQQSWSLHGPRMEQIRLHIIEDAL